MLKQLIYRFLPDVVEEIGSAEADRMCAMMAKQGYIQSETDTDVLVFGLVKVIPKSDLRESDKKALDIA